MAASVQQWFPFSLEPAVEQVIRQVDFSWCMEDPVIANLPGDAPFWIVRREKLDQLLADQAIGAGAERRTGVEVDGINRRGDFWQVTATDGRRGRNGWGWEPSVPRWQPRCRYDLRARATWPMEAHDLNSGW